jgi:hypothetical protein
MKRGIDAAAIRASSHSRLHEGFHTLAGFMYARLKSSDQAPASPPSLTSTLDIWCVSSASGEPKKLPPLPAGGTKDGDGAGALSRSRSRAMRPRNMPLLMHQRHSDRSPALHITWRSRRQGRRTDSTPTGQHAKDRRCSAGGGTDRHRTSNSRRHPTQRSVKRAAPCGYPSRPLRCAPS